MKANITIITAFLLMVALAPGLAFYDDFQIYNDVTNPYFTSNYSYNASINNNTAGNGTWTIQSAANVYLRYHNDYGGGIADKEDLGAVNLNYSKISANANFNLNFSILSGSIIGPSTADGGFISVAYFVNNTDSAENRFANLKGYVVNFGSLYPSMSQYIELRRCSSGLSAPLTCGVQLAYGAFNLTNTYLTYGLTSGEVVNNSIFFDLNYNPATALLTATIAGNPVLNYTDSVYNSGGFVIYGHHHHDNGQSVDTNLDLDNLSISGVTAGATAGWVVSSYPQNLDSWIGFSRDGLNTDYSGCAGGTGLKGTFYGINYQPCKYFYESAYPANVVLTPSFVLKYNGALWSKLLNNVTPISTIGVYAHTLNGNACYWVKSDGVKIPITNNPSFYNGGMSSATLLFADTAPYVRDTNPYLYRGLPFVCVQAENVTFQIEFNQGGPLTDIYLTIPIGYSFDPITKVVNYSVTIDAALNDTSGNEVINTPLTPGINEFTDFGGLSGLVTPLTVLLSAVLIAGAVITRDTKSSQIGLIVIMAGCLMLSFYGILPWYITVLITIGAGFFILSQVRTGVFGNAQTA